MTREVLSPRRVATRWGLAALASVGVHLVVLGVAVALLSLRPPAASASVVAAPRAPAFTRVGLFGAAPRASRGAATEPAVGASAAAARAAAGARAPRAVAPSDSAPGEAARAPVDQALPELVAAPPSLDSRGAGDGEGSGGGTDVAGTVAPGAADGQAGRAGAPSPAQAQGPAGVPAVDVDALVHAQLVRVAARCYPAAARRFRQAGEVLVHFCVDQAGAVASSEVHRSSQSPVLDGAATQCVVPQAAPFPPGAFGRCFDVPVRFGAP